MDYNLLLKERAMILNRIEELTKGTEFELSIRYLTSIHYVLFKNVYETHGSFRKDNINKDEDILNGDTVDYPDYHTIATYLKFAFEDEKKVNYKSLTKEEIAKRIAHFTAEVWQIHPFIEGNTRTTCVFIKNYLRSLGYEVDNHIFKEHAEYFRNCLVRASYQNERYGVKKDPKPLEAFFLAALNNTEIEEKDLTVTELFNKMKIKRRANKIYL